MVSAFRTAALWCLRWLHLWHFQVREHKIRQGKHEKGTGIQWRPLMLFHAFYFQGGWWGRSVTVWRSWREYRIFRLRINSEWAGMYQSLNSTLDGIADRGPRTGKGAGTQGLGLGLATGRCETLEPLNRGLESWDSDKHGQERGCWGPGAPWVLLHMNNGEARWRVVQYLPQLHWG